MDRSAANGALQNIGMFFKIYFSPAYCPFGASRQWIVLTIKAEESVVNLRGDSGWSSGSGFVYNAVTCMKPVFPHENSFDITTQYRAYGGFRNFMLQKNPEL